MGWARSGRITAMLAAAALSLMGCTPASAPTPTAAGLVSVPLATVPDDVTVLGASGDALWVSFPSYQSVYPSGNRVSLDGGATWQDGVSADSLASTAAGAGRFGYFGSSGDISQPVTFAAADPSGLLKNTGWGETWQLAALGASAALSTQGKVVSVVADTAEATVATAHFADLPSGVGKVTQTYQFSADSRYVVRFSHTAKGTTDYASVVATATGKAAGRIALARSTNHQVGGSGIYNLAASADGLSLCRVELPAGTPSCSQVAAGNHVGAKVVLHQQGAFSLIDDPVTGAALLVEDGRVTTMKLPDGTRSWSADGSGDPTRPLVRTVDATAEPHHYRVAVDGSLSEYLAVPRVAERYTTLALNPTTLIGSGVGGHANQYWTREVSADALGPSTYHDGILGAASGERILVWGKGDDPKLQVYDRGRHLTTMTGVAATTLSGPYLLADGEVRLVNGAKLTASEPEAIFGSLVAEHLEGGSGYRVRVRDLADAKAASVTVTLADAVELFGAVSLWGDWIATTLTAGTGQEVVAQNYRTKQEMHHTGNLVYLGDGFAVVEVVDEATSSDTLSLWNFATGTDTALGDAGSHPVVAGDGNRIAYLTATDLVVRSIDGVGMSAPRLLGALASGKPGKGSGWQVELDLTKPVQAGTLVITDANARVVRTLPTPAAASGAIAAITWDGRDDAGGAVAAGTYHWTLSAQGADGSGEVRDVAGTGTAQGDVVVG